MKPTLPQGTRDFNADTIRKRNHIFNTIRKVFELYGFQPLETPAMENIETLTGKYGEEGDQLLYKIRSNKNLFKTDPAKAEAIKNILKDVDDTDLTFFPHKTKTALRYDLTIPFARYVAMNYGQLNFPFKRYQMQPVWRGDRPQKGRYREFYQCDADIVGSNSLMNEIELLNIYRDVFKLLDLPVELKINNRKLLTALADLCGGTSKLTDITVAIDKLDKTGVEKVKEELNQRGLTEEQVGIIENYLRINGTNEDKLNAIKQLFGENETAKKGIEELEFILSFQSGVADLQNPITFDPTLARGLNYYTGTIIEVKAKKVQMGSIGGGGRYDDLTGLFDVPDLPGVGISFGVDRIYDVMEELKLFPVSLQDGTRVLFFNLGKSESKTAYFLMQQLRNKNIKCEIFHEQAKFDKQFKYAERKNISYIIIIGSKELESGNCTIKNLHTGAQQTIQQSELNEFPFE
jgi:histidyl-tRNA synthetase